MERKKPVGSLEGDEGFEVGKTRQVLSRIERRVVRKKPVGSPERDEGFEVEKTRQVFSRKELEDSGKNARAKHSAL
jgi:hypothetical protein